MAQQLSSLGRRALGHLPIWLADQARVEERAAEGQVSTLEAFSRRLAEDPNVDPQTEAQNLQTLTALASYGLCEDVDGDWRMTQLGLETLNAPVQTPEQDATAVVLELQPAVIESGTALS